MRSRPSSAWQAPHTRDICGAGRQGLYAELSFASLEPSSPSGFSCEAGAAAGLSQLLTITCHFALDRCTVLLGGSRRHNAGSLVKAWCARQRNACTHNTHTHVHTHTYTHTHTCVHTHTHLSSSCMKFDGKSKSSTDPSMSMTRRTSRRTSRSLKNSNRSSGSPSYWNNGTTRHM